MANIIINNVQPVSGIPSLSFLSFLAYCQPHENCSTVAMHQLLRSSTFSCGLVPVGMMSQDSRSASPLPQCSEKPNFCIQGQQRYLGPQNSKWTLLSRMSGATEEIISPFCLWIKTCKISLKCVLSNAFLYVFFFPLNIFLMSSAAFKDFINLKKERKIKIPLLFFEALVLYLFEGDLESGKAEVGRVMSVLFSDVLVIH